MRLAPNEGVRNAGCQTHPQSRVQWEWKHTRVVTTNTPEPPGVPHAMVLTACCVSHPRWPMLSTPPLCGLTDFATALCTRSSNVILPLGAKHDAPGWHALGRPRAASSSRHRHASLPGKPGIVTRVTAIEHRSRPPHPAPRLV